MNIKDNGIVAHLLRRRMEAANRVSEELVGKTFEISGWPYPYTKDKETFHLRMGQEKRLGTAGIAAGV